MAADNLKVELQNAGIPWILGVWSSGFSLLRDHSVAIVRIAVAPGKAWGKGKWR
jgi:hypothetical protein